MSYELTKIYRFSCDQPECRRRQDLDDAERIAEALQSLGYEDWQVIKGKQFCPDHHQEKTS